MELREFPFDRQLLRIYIEISDIDPLPANDKSWDYIGEEPFSVTESITDFKYHSFIGKWEDSKNPAFDAQCTITVLVG